MGSARQRRKRKIARASAPMANAEFGVECRAGIVPQIRMRGRVGFEITAEAVEKALAQHRNAREIRVVVNSGGGSVFVAAEIYQLLRDHPARIIGVIEGVAASAMTTILMAADEVHMAANAHFMIHGARGRIEGTQQQVEDYAQLLRNTNDLMANTYVTRTGLSRERIDQMMSRDTWLTAKQAKELNFVTRIIEDKGVTPHVAPRSEIDCEQTIDVADLPRVAQQISSLVANVNGQSTEQEIDPMFAQWLKDTYGLDIADLTAEQKEKFESVYAAAGSPDGEQTPAPSQAGDQRPERGASPEVRNVPTAGVTVGGDGASDPVNEMLQRQAFIMRRTAEIQALCGSNLQVAADAIASLAEPNGGWDNARINDALELARLREQTANQPTNDDGGFVPLAFNINVPQGVTRENELDCVEAALCMEMGIDAEQLMDPYGDLTPEQRRGWGPRDLEPISEQTVETAERHYRGIGLQEAVIHHCRHAHAVNAQTGHSALGWRGDHHIRAAYTTLSMPLTFGRCVERELLNAYRILPQEWRGLCSVASARDFRETATKFRVFGTGAWEHLTPDGEIRHGQLDEGPGYKNQLDTQGQMNVLTRQDFINDDLGALRGLARMMSTYGALAPEFAFFQAILNAPATFFTADNTLSGAPLGYAGLEAAWQKWCGKVEETSEKSGGGRNKGMKKDREKAPRFLDIDPSILLVPKCKQPAAQKLMTETTLVLDGGQQSPSTFIAGQTNEFAGRYQVRSSNYLASVSFNANASSENWYLMVDPNVVAAFEMLFLNGVQRPTIERVEPRPELLGFGFRGYIDLNCKEQDPLGILKLTP